MARAGWAALVREAAGTDCSARNSASLVAFLSRSAAPALRLHAHAINAEARSTKVIHLLFKK